MIIRHHIVFHIAILTDSLKMLARTGNFAERMLKLYPAKTEQETYYAQSDIFRDGSFAWGTYAWANLQSKTGNPNGGTLPY